MHFKQNYVCREYTLCVQVTLKHLFWPFRFPLLPRVFKGAHNSTLVLFWCMLLAYCVHVLNLVRVCAYFLYTGDISDPVKRDWIKAQNERLNMGLSDGSSGKLGKDTFDTKVIQLLPQHTHAHTHSHTDTHRHTLTYTRTFTHTSTAVRPFLPPLTLTNAHTHTPTPQTARRSKEESCFKFNKTCLY